MALPGLGHPLVELSFLNEGLRVLLGLQEAEDSHYLPARRQVRLLPLPSPCKVGPPGAEWGGNLLASALANSTSLPNSRHISLSWVASKIPLALASPRRGQPWTAAVSAPFVTSRGWHWFQSWPGFNISVMGLVFW